MPRARDVRIFRPIVNMPGPSTKKRGRRNEYQNLKHAAINKPKFDADV